MSDSTMRPVQTFADHLSSLIQPTSWDISVATVVERLAHWIDSDSLLAHLTPIAPMLAGTPSGTALDIAYGTEDAPRDLESACAALVAEIELERDWATWRVPAQPWWQRSSSSVTGRLGECLRSPGGRDRARA